MDIDQKAIQDAEEAAERIRKIREQAQSPSGRAKIQEQFGKRKNPPQQ